MGTTYQISTCNLRQGRVPDESLIQSARRAASKFTDFDRPADTREKRDNASKKLPLKEKRALLCIKAVPDKRHIDRCRPSASKRNVVVPEERVSKRIEYHPAPAWHCIIFRGDGNNLQTELMFISHARPVEKISTRYVCVSSH